VSRRLELPDEFIFQDGTKVLNPQDLAARLGVEPERFVEVWQRLQGGELERWLFQGGWEAMAQHIVYLRQTGKDLSSADLLSILRMGNVPQIQPSQTMEAKLILPDTPPSPTLKAFKETVLQRHGKTKPQPLGEQTTYSFETRIVERQTQTLRSFWEEETHRNRVEEEETRKLQEVETGARQRVAAAKSEAANILQQAREGRESAWNNLLKASLTPPQENGRPLQTAGIPKEMLAGAANQVREKVKQIESLVAKLQRVRESNTTRKAVLGFVTLLLLFIGMGAYFTMNPRTSVSPPTRYEPHKSKGQAPSSPPASQPMQKSMNSFAVGRQWAIDWQSMFRYQGVMQIQQQLKPNQFLARITVNFVNKNKKITVSMDGLLTINGKNVVIKCSNASESWWDTDDFYMEWHDDTLIGYNIDKKGRRGKAVFRLVSY